MSYVTVKDMRRMFEQAIEQDRYHIVITIIQDDEVISNVYGQGISNEDLDFLKKEFFERKRKMRSNSIVMDANKPEWLNDFQVMSLKPDDIVVLKFKRPLSSGQHRYINESWKRFKADTRITNNVLILEDGTEIGILSPEK